MGVEMNIKQLKEFYELGKANERQILLNILRYGVGYKDGTPDLEVLTETQREMILEQLITIEKAMHEL